MLQFFVFFKGHNKAFYLENEPFLYVFTLIFEWQGKKGKQKP